MNNKHKAIFWVVLASFCNVINDFFMQQLSHGVGFDLEDKLSIVQISFLRFLSSTVILLPFVSLKALSLKNNLTSNYCTALLHLTRAALGVIAMLLWCYGISYNPLYIASQINLLTPFIGVIMAITLLKEKTSKMEITTLFVMLLSLGTIVLIDQYTSSIISPKGIICLFISVLLFALMDILNKHMTSISNNINLIWYFSAISTIILAIVLTITSSWSMNLNFKNLLIIGLLGLGANGVLYCLLQAFRNSYISDLSPWRYSDLLFAIGFDIILNKVTPSIAMATTSMVIIGGSLIFVHFKCLRERETIVSKISSSCDPSKIA